MVHITNVFGEIEMNWLRYRICFLLVVSILLGTSCKSLQSGPSVVGGELTDGYPLVVKIEHLSYTKPTPEDNQKSHCSAVIVSSNTLLTASHCIVDDVYNDKETGTKVYYYQEVQVEINGKIYNTSKVKFNPLYVKYLYDLTDRDYYHRFDIAVVVFDMEPFKGIEPGVLERKLPAPNTPIRLVGFGPYDWNELESSGKKATGVNRVTKNTLCPEGSLEIRTEVDKESERTLLPVSFHGDSGSPVFIEGSLKIIGITSGPADGPEGTEYDESIACYAFPMLKENIEFLKSAKKELGAKFSGLDL